MDSENIAQFLSQVSSNPSLLKDADEKTLDALASEIRTRIIETVAKNGGHLAPNLGVVELTLALISSFEFPTDEVVWDVGHQCYPWKLLTGRNDSFETIRTKDGIAGFPKREESEYDSFNTGHSATSISAALGKLVASSLSGQKKNIIAVIGDGALTGGLALEGLNHAGRLAGKQKGRLIVILNDNEMSIDLNVGAFSSYLNSIRTEPFYRDNRDYARDLIKSVPRIGSRLYSILAKIEGSLKYLVVPGIVFEELGFTYLGPVDGHDVSMLIEVLKDAQSVNNKPVLIHVKTEKGKGYKPAELNQPSFHGTGPFDLSNGRRHKVSGPVSYTQAFGEAMVNLGKKDDKICAVTAAMTLGTGLSDFANEFKDRFYDVGIAEQHAVTFAAGMATEGMKPVVAIYSTFMQRAFDQVLHDVALQSLPVVFALDRAGLVGEDGPTHHGAFDISVYRSVPNLIFGAPGNECDLAPMLEAMVASGSTSMIRYPRGAGTGLVRDPSDSDVVVGKGSWVVDGTDAVIIAIGSMVRHSVEAAELAEEAGYSIGVFDARFICPLDEAALLEVANRDIPIISVEENVLAGGFGSSLLDFYEIHNLRPILKRIGIPDKFICHGSCDLLFEEIGLNSQAICGVVIEVVKSCSIPCREPALSACC
jgi:1-deoxy-D-xylulose-5-phosphate synthase